MSISRFWRVSAEKSGGFGGKRQKKRLWGAHGSLLLPQRGEEREEMMRVKEFLLSLHHGHIEEKADIGYQSRLFSLETRIIEVLLDPGRPGQVPKGNS